MTGEWEKWLEECKKTARNDFDTIACMQSRINNFIDNRYGVKRINACEWVERDAIYALMEVGEVIEELDVKHWKKKEVDRKKLLEELVDVLHFIVSIAIDSGHGDFEANVRARVPCFDDLCAARHLLKLSAIIDEIVDRFCEGEPISGYLMEMFDEYFGVVNALGFGFDDVFEMYLYKNRVNFERHKTKKK